MNQRLIRFKSAFIKNDEMWCAPTAVNWLLKINLNDWSVKSVCNLELDAKFRVDYIYQCGDYVWCITDIGVRVIAYHMLTGEIEHFKLPKEDQRRNRGVVFFDGKLWILPIELPGKMISFDLLAKKFEIHNRWEKECLKWKVIGKAVSFCQIENMVYMTLRDECKIIQYELTEETIKIKKLPGKLGLRCVFAVGDKIFVTSFAKRMLFEWNKSEDTINKIYCPYLKDKPYRRGMEFGNKILLMDNETIDIFDPQLKKISSYNEIQKKLEANYEALTSWPLFFEAMIYNKKYFLITWGADMLLEFSFKQKKWSSHKLRIPEELFLEEYVLKRISTNHLNHEEEVSIKDFIYYVMNAYNKKRNPELEKQIGCEIYKHLLTDS